MSAALRASPNGQALLIADTGFQPSADARQQQLPNGVPVANWHPRFLWHGQKCPAYVI